MKPRFFYFPTLGCANDLPTVEFDHCDPEFNLSEVRRIFIAKPIAQPFTDWKLETEWLSRLSDNSTSGDDYIRTLVVRGNKPAPASVIKALTNLRNKKITKNHTLNFLVDETNDTNHEFLRELEGSNSNFKIWYETHGGKMFGGNSGIVVDIDLNMVLAEGEEEIQTYVGVATWKNKVTEEMAISPIFDFGNTSSVATYDTTLEFSSTTSDTGFGITATVAEVDPDAKLEFNKIDPQLGTPVDMDINIGGLQYMSVSYTSDYLGRPFRFIDQSGVSHTGVFVEGNANF